MTVSIHLTCGRVPGILCCDDDEAFSGVETVAAARALMAVMHPETAANKIARVAVSCEIAGCPNMILFKNTDSVTEGRANASTHNYGWYTARRAGGRLVDGCQWHLGSCCVHHARRLWRGHPHPTLDSAAVLPGEPGFPGQADTGPAQLDLFGSAA
ncbi:hypothetical protein [Microtetraspora malaysiensis]|uniref:Uncharacterized protein n=1 Tax=Microtetraspora malaysiensis TaxID=161358 RepID=A0ABW6SKB5_9ACTN